VDELSGTFVPGGVTNGRTKRAPLFPALVRGSDRQAGENIVAPDTLAKRASQSSDKFHSEEIAELQEWLAATVAMIAGFLDAFGIITYDTYVSFMSGNTTNAGYRIGLGNCWAAAPSVLAIVFFVGGSFVGALLAHSAVPRIRRLVFGVVAALLVLIVAYTRFGFSSGWVPIGMISFAMGAMNTALSRVGAQYVSLTFVTGTLSRIGVQLALAARRAPLPDSQGSWDTHVYRTLLLAGIWAGFLGGALLSGAMTPRFGAWVLLLPILILSALMVLDRTASPAV
jgi:uncharacterized membrane protein YoaK (UPF0700 family)